MIDNVLISSKDTLLSKLYNGLMEDHFETDKEAILNLYGSNDEKAKQNFRRLKSRLSLRILNTLYFLDMNLYSIKEQYERIAYEQRRLVSAINILKRNGAREAAIKIIKDNYQTAEKFYLYDVLKYYDFELCIYYSLNDNSKEFKNTITSTIYMLKMKPWYRRPLFCIMTLS
jgi:hypothetical protein